MTGFLFAETASAEPFDLVFGAAPYNNEAVETLVHTRFDEERSFDENGIGDSFRLPFRKLNVHSGFDARMQSGIQFREFFSVRKNDGAELFAIDRIVFAKDFFSELTHDVFVCGLSPFDKLVAEEVGVENAKIQFAQLVGDPTFAAGDSSGEAEFEHFESSARGCGRMRFRRSPAEAGGFDGVAHEHSNGHRADATGNGGKRAGRVNSVGMNVADEDGTFFAEFCEALRKVPEELFGFKFLGDFVGADIDDGGAGLEPI